jgi:hypothetical protein
MQGELATECWNLRKTILDQNSENMKLRKILKSNQNLIKNLQKEINEIQNESLVKSKDITSKRTLILELNKKIQDITSTNSFLNNTYIKNKKMIVNLEKKIEEMSQEKLLLKEKLYVLLFDRFSFLSCDMSIMPNNIVNILNYYSHNYHHHHHSYHYYIRHFIYHIHYHHPISVSLSSPSSYYRHSITSTVKNEMKSHESVLSLEIRKVN